MYAQVVRERPVRRGGFAPALSDEEVITVEICGAYFKHHKDCDLYDYFAAHYRHFLSHTVMVFLNLQLGRDPLDLDGLVTA
jgi:hypothetical protein